MNRVDTNWAALQDLAQREPAVADAIAGLTPEAALEVTEYAEAVGISSWLEAFAARQDAPKPKRRKTREEE